jgi:threonylcarbamoyladenosine tRNA methylthiotransferase MtaB
LRLSSLDPREVSGELLTVIAESTILCPHLHVCVQAGDDALLKAMRRNYDTAYFEATLTRARQLLPHAALGTDLIVGFPGESDASFQRSLDFLNRLPLTYFHVFPYSTRAGTLAASRPDQVPAEAKKERSRLARDMGTKKKHAFYRSHMGEQVRVLVERVSQKEQGFVRGYSENYLPITLPGSAELINQEVPVGIERWAGGRLWGTPLEGH